MQVILFKKYMRMQYIKMYMDVKQRNSKMKRISCLILQISLRRVFRGRILLKIGLSRLRKRIR